MKALLLADLYQAWVNCKFYLLFVAVAAAVTAAGSGAENNTGTFMSVYAMIMCSMMGMTLMQLDETSRWNVYAQALPATRKDQVSSKYVVTLLCFGLVWALFAAIYAILALTGRLLWVMAGTQIAILAVIGLLAPAFSLPAMYRWGSNKGRIIFIFVLVLLGAGAGAFVSVLPLGSFSLPAIPAPVLIALAVLLPVLLFIGSWFLAVRWYEKREL